MKKLLIFNWKMAPNSLKEAKRLLNAFLNLKSEILNRFEVVICPPFVYLSLFNVGRFNLPKIDKKNIRRLNLQNIKLAAQNVFWENPPAGGSAYTGEISAIMLKNLGVEYVIIGHSERRQYLGETDEMLNKKVLAGLKSGLKIILCVGENLSIRKRGKKAVKNYIKKQLEKDLKGILNLKSEILNLIIAYEPIWAIGTGVPCRPEDALEMIKYIKKLLNAKPYALNPRVLYGGSVAGKNIQNFIQLKEIDGVLVGGASVKAAEVKKIIEITSRHSA